MAAYDFRAQRLFVEEDLAQGEAVALGRDPSHYLVNVLRLAEGAPVILFNGRDGEWLASLARAGKKGAVVVPERRVRPQTPAGDLHYLFAPLKHARLDYMVQKAVEMGASTIRPVVTRSTRRCPASISNGCGQMRSRRPSSAAFSPSPRLVEK